MTRRPDDVRNAIDTTLSGASHDPTLFNCVVNASKGDTPPVKKKLTLSMAIIMILLALTGTVAIAATYRGVQYFLTEKTNEQQPLDPDYLFSGMQQYHNSKRLNAVVVDAYWDGVEMSVAYRVTPVDPSHVIRMYCPHKGSVHAQITEDADILLYEPEFIYVTDEYGESIIPYRFSTDWCYEEDGSITVFVRFPHYDMSQPDNISIPIFNYLIAAKDNALSMLHFSQPTLADPVTEHEHNWAAATCVSPKMCTICHRTEGDLGYHNYQPSEDPERLVCPVCTISTARPFNIPDATTLVPGDYNNFVIALQRRLTELGYYFGPISGMYDEATTAAVTVYQGSQGLPATGICDPDTHTRLLP